MIVSHLVGLPISIEPPSERLLMYGDAECEIEDKFNYGAPYEEVEMKFSTLSAIDRINPVAFLIHCVSGEKYVIGQKEGPFPDVEITETILPLRHVFKVKVKFSSRKAVIPCSF